MDVHPPHGAIHSVKDFLLHLLAITIGLLIALGLEGSVGWWHHHRLVVEARANLVQEINVNRSELQRELTALPGEDGHLQDLLRNVGEMQNGHEQKLPSNYMWSFTRLADAAWSTSSATGATGFMRYDEVSRYEQVYATQQAFNTLMGRYIDSRLEMYAYMEPMSNGSKLSSAELEGAKHAIASQIMTNRALREIGSGLSTGYARFVSQTQ